MLAARTDWVETEPDLSARLMRAVWKSARWLGAGGSQTTAAEMLSQPQYLDLAPDIIDRALTGRLTINARGDTRDCPAFIDFYRGAASFPWKSQAVWIAYQMAARLGLDRANVGDLARSTFRTDVYRRALADTGAILPGASEKVEGRIVEGTAAAAQSGRLILAENRFFDDRIFDPTGIS